MSSGVARRVSHIVCKTYQKCGPHFSGGFDLVISIIGLGIFFNRVHIALMYVNSNFRHPTRPGEDLKQMVFLPCKRITLFIHKEC